MRIEKRSTNPKKDIRQSDEFLRSELFKALSDDQSQELPSSNEERKKSLPPMNLGKLLQLVGSKVDSKYNFFNFPRVIAEIAIKKLAELGKENLVHKHLKGSNIESIASSIIKDLSNKVDYQVSLTHDQLEEINTGKIPDEIRGFISPYSFVSLVIARAEKMAKAEEYKKKSSEKDKKSNLLDIAADLKSLAEKLEEEYQITMTKNRRFEG